jgi:cell division protein FtsI/penicillin-binding protein 2
MEGRKLLSRRRIRFAEIGISAVCVGFVGVFGVKYVINPYVLSSSAATKNTVVYNAIKDYVVEGDITDNAGNIILGNASAGVSATAASPENYSYAWLLGYYSVNSGKENSFGLRGNLKEYSLYYLDQANKGATVKLTTNTGLQNYAYSLLNGEEGSITVLENKTGAIQCLTSQSTIDYNVNDTNTLLNTTVEGSQYRRGTYEVDPPGSTFKVVTAAAALKKQEDENLSDSFFDYVDNGTYVPAGSDFTITNYANRSYGNVDLESGLNHSINTYFANLGVKVGGSLIQDMASKFMIGKTIEIPFLGTITSSIDDLSKADTAEIAQSAFGQGHTQVTPFNMALIAQAIANNGEMMAPYIVSSIHSGKLPLYHFFQHKLSTVLDSTVDTKLKTIMHSTAVGYGLSEAQYGMVYAKTGTAECADGRIHTYIIGFTEKYSFCISMNNSSTSETLWGTARQLVNYLNQIAAK